MNKIYKNILIAAAMAGSVFLASCGNDEAVYDGPAYIMFSDSSMVFPVTGNGAEFAVTVSATKKSGSDRVFGIEILQSESNAIDGYHYTLSSNTVTIPAGQMTGSIAVKGIYDHIGPEDSLNIKMKIVSMDDDVKWNLYGDEANVLLKKACPMDIRNYTGYAVLTSGLINAINPNRTPKRLITTKAVEGNDRVILLQDFFYDGFDVEITVDDSNVLEPSVSIEDGTQIGEAQSLLGIVFGDNAVRVSDVSGYASIALPCYDRIILYTIVYVSNGVEKRYLGAFYNEIQWVSEAEAEDIIHNGF